MDRSNLESITPKLRESGVTALLDFNPSLLPTSSTLLSTLIKTGVSNYLEFKLLTQVFLYLNDSLCSGPMCKEDVFGDPSVGLLEKRKLMRFFKGLVEGLVLDIGNQKTRVELTF